MVRGEKGAGWLGGSWMVRGEKGAGWLGGKRELDG